MCVEKFFVLDGRCSVCVLGFVLVCVWCFFLCLNVV